MSNISWPAALPSYPLQSSWSRGGQASKWTFEPDAGLTYARPAGRKGDSLYVSFLMTAAQEATFINFFHNILREGVLCFNWYDPDSQQNLLVRFDPSSNDAYSVSAKGLTRTVSMKWEIMPE